MTVPGDHICRKEVPSLSALQRTRAAVPSPAQCHDSHTVIPPCHPRERGARYAVRGKTIATVYQILYPRVADWKRTRPQHGGGHCIRERWHGSLRRHGRTKLPRVSETQGKMRPFGSHVRTVRSVPETLCLREAFPDAPDKEVRQSHYRHVARFSRWRITKRNLDSGT